MSDDEQHKLTAINLGSMFWIGDKCYHNVCLMLVMAFGVFHCCPGYLMASVATFFAEYVKTATSWSNLQLAHDAVVGGNLMDIDMFTVINFVELLGRTIDIVEIVDEKLGVQQYKFDGAPSKNVYFLREKDHFYHIEQPDTCSAPLTRSAQFTLPALLFHFAPSNRCRRKMVKKH